MHRECMTLRHYPPAHYILRIYPGSPYIPCIHTLPDMCCTALDIRRRLMYPGGVLCIHQSARHSKYHPSARAPTAVTHNTWLRRTRAHHCTTSTSHFTESSWGSYSGPSGRTTSTSRRACHPKLRAHSSSLTARASLSPAYILIHPGRTRRRSRTSPPSFSSATSRRCRARRPVRAPTSSPTRRYHTSYRTHNAAWCATRIFLSDFTTSAGAVIGHR